MDKKELLKSPLLLIIATGIVIVILYFIMSPYQICISEYGNDEVLLCQRYTSW